MSSPGLETTMTIQGIPTARNASGSGVVPCPCYASQRAGRKNYSHSSKTFYKSPWSLCPFTSPIYRRVPHAIDHLNQEIFAWWCMVNEARATIKYHTSTEMQKERREREAEL
eukprot:scaffold964_cov170-Amphora_coffeaeformis.AAC.7